MAIGQRQRAENTLAIREVSIHETVLGQGWMCSAWTIRVTVKPTVQATEQGKGYGNTTTRSLLIGQDGCIRQSSYLLNAPRTTYNNTIIRGFTYMTGGKYSGVPNRRGPGDPIAKLRFFPTWTRLIRNPPYSLFLVWNPTEFRLFISDIRVYRC